MTEDTIIDASNFSEYFFDVSKNRPKPGQIMAKYSAVAYFGAGPEKKDVIQLLTRGKALAAAKVMNKIHHAKMPTNYVVCREMCEDLLSGMSIKEVEEKEYRFIIEAFYYTQREYVPTDDIHWETIELLQYDEVNQVFKSYVGELPEGEE